MKKNMLTHNIHPHFNIKLNVAICNDLCPLQYHKKKTNEFYYRQLSERLLNELFLFTYISYKCQQNGKDSKRMMTSDC